MRILEPADVQLTPMDKRYIPSRTKCGVTFIVVTGLLSLPFIFLWRDGVTTGKITAAVICGLIFLPVLKWYIKSWSADAWKAALTDRHLLLKSMLTESKKDIILELNLAEIRTVRKLTENYTRYKIKKGRLRTRPHTDQLLELELDGAGAPRAAGRPEPMDGIERNDSALRLNLSSRWLNPETILADLSAPCTVLPEQHLTHPRPDLTDKQQTDDYIRFLMKKGDTLGAGDLAQEAFGLNFSDARDYIQDLMRA